MKRTGMTRVLVVLLSALAAVSQATTDVIHSAGLRGAAVAIIQPTTHGAQLHTTRSMDTSIPQSQLTSMQNGSQVRSLATNYYGGGSNLWIFQDPSTWNAQEVAIFILLAFLISILLCFSICCCCRCRFSLWDIFAIFCCWEICCDDGRMISGAFDTALV